MVTYPHHAGSTFGILLARRVDSSSLAVLRLSSLRLEGEEGMPSWASSSMSSWLCLLGSRGKRWLFLSDQFPMRRDWLLGFEGSCRNNNSLSSSLSQQHLVHRQPCEWAMATQGHHARWATTPWDTCKERVQGQNEETGVSIYDFKVKKKEPNNTFGFGEFPCSHITSTL